MFRMIAIAFLLIAGCSGADYVAESPFDRREPVWATTGDLRFYAAARIQVGFGGPDQIQLEPGTQLEHLGKQYDDISHQWVLYVKVLEGEHAGAEAHIFRDFVR